MLWCSRCRMWSARTPCRHCSPRKFFGLGSAFRARHADPKHLWTILLAAGEGKNFGDFSVQRLHFWSVDGTGGMVSWALGRAKRLVARDHIVAITRAEHALWAEPRFRDLPPDNVLVEPTERGSAPGLLLALMKITQVDPEAVVVLLPCDHHV